MSDSYGEKFETGTIVLMCALIVSCLAGVFTLQCVTYTDCTASKYTYCGEETH